MYNTLVARYTNAGIKLTEEEKEILRVVAKRSEKGEKGWKLEFIREEKPGKQ